MIGWLRSQNKKGFGHVASQEKSRLKIQTKERKNVACVRQIRIKGVSKRLLKIPYKAFPVVASEETWVATRNCHNRLFRKLIRNRSNTKPYSEQINVASTIFAAIDIIEGKNKNIFLKDILRSALEWHTTILKERIKKSIVLHLAKTIFVIIPLFFASYNQ